MSDTNVAAMRLTAVRRIVVFVICSTFPPHAMAHAENHADSRWTLDPWVWLPMAIFGVLYFRGVVALRAKRRAISAIRPHAVAAFIAGMAALFLALIWPFDALGAASFAAHMTQHMLLMAVAAPLFAIAEPSVPVMLALPASWRRTNPGLTCLRMLRRIFLQPRVAFAVHAAVIWIWHAPVLFELALQQEAVHALEHIAFLGSALLFWASLRQAGRAGGAGYGIAMLWMLATLMHTGLLGALITFSPRLLYSTYTTAVPLLSPMEDQQLAGLIMWIPAGFCYLAADIGYAAAWLRAAERTDRYKRHTASRQIRQ